MSLWEESTRVPLYIVTPESKGGTNCKQAVSLLDIYPTLLDLCQLPLAEHLDGRSLKPLLDNPSQEWDYPTLISWRYQNYAVRSNNFRYIQYRDGSEELYDHTKDPDEFNNVAHDAAYSTQVEWHRQHIPQATALPVGVSEWNGDEIDARIEEWKTQNNMPEWLK